MRGDEDRACKVYDESLVGAHDNSPSPSARNGRAFPTPRARSAPNASTSIRPPGTFASCASRGVSGRPRRVAPGRDDRVPPIEPPPRPPRAAPRARARERAPPRKSLRASIVDTSRRAMAKTRRTERRRAPRVARTVVVVGACVVVGVARAVPARAATCSNDGSDYAYSETISGTQRVVTITNCPNHARDDAVGNNPNSATYSGTKTFSVPAYPKLQTLTAGSLTETKSLASQGAQVGVLFSGAWMFSPYGGPTYGTVTGYANSATAAEGDTFDMSGCHSTGQSDSYHCHIVPIYLVKQLNQTAGSHSPQVGWAADGFPIYGPKGPGGVEMKECTGSAGSVWGTDACTKNGAHLGALPTVDDYKLRYYFQGDQNPTDCTNPFSDLPDATTHPHAPLSFFGCKPSGATTEVTGVTTCTSSAVDGYTFTGTPATKSALSIYCDSCWASSDGGASTTGSGCTATPSPPSSDAAGLRVALAVVIASCVAFIA